eukprot:SAG22_NODE_2759_length_2238_cov_1.535297_1_plen_92_part_10
MLAKEPRERLQASDATKHAWFTGLAANNAQTLHDVHSLLQTFVLTTGLPKRHFKAGQFLVSSLDPDGGGRGDSGSDEPPDEVYLLDKGECEV